MSGIDFSDEGLSGRIEGVEDAPEPEAVEETPEVDQATDEATPDADEATAEDAGDGDDGSQDEAAGDDTEVAVDSPETPNEWQVRYDEAQKVIGRQGQELGELRRMMEQIQQAQQQPVEEQPVFTGPQPTTSHELLELAATPESAVDAYQFAVQHAPDLIPDVLAEVQMHDPGLAKRMELDLYQQMLQAQIAPVQQSYEQASVNQQAASVVENYSQQVEGWESIKDEVAKIIEEEPWLVADGSPEAIERGLRAATRMAQQARQVQAQHAEAQAQVQRVQQRQAAVVETGTPAAAPAPEELSEADAIKNAIFAEDKRRRAIFD